MPSGIRLAGAVVALSLAMLHGTANATPVLASLGAAAGYGAFVFGDFTSSSSDTQTNLAVGGNANLSNYAVGQSTSPGTSAKLVVGGNLSGQNGSVGPGGAGAIYVGGSNSSSLTAATKSQNLPSSQLPIDFAAAKSQYQSLSQTLFNTAATGSVVNQYGTLTLTGTASDVNYFTVQASDWNSANTVNINVAKNSTIVINILGTSVVFQNGQISINGTSGENNAANALTLYNLYQATSLSLPGSKAPQGSVLAPFASVTGGYGQLNGQLIAQSFSGNTQFNRPDFAGAVTTAVPVPGTLPLLASGLVLLGWLAWSGRRQGHAAAVARA